MIQLSGIKWQYLVFPKLSIAKESKHLANITPGLKEDSFQWQQSYTTLHEKLPNIFYHNEVEAASWDK